MNDPLLTIERRVDVLSRLKIGKTSLQDRINNDLFPPPIKLGGARAVGWFQHETTVMLSAMAAGKDKDETKNIVSEIVTKRKQYLEVVQ
jgi:prophage regulatory protein